MLLLIKGASIINFDQAITYHKAANIMKIRITLYLTTLLLVLSFSAPAFSKEKHWRGIALNSFQARQGATVNAPVISDLAISSRGEIYIVTTTRRLNRLDGEIWVPADGRKVPIGRDKKGFYTYMEIYGEGKYKRKRLIKLKEPDRMIGIAARVAVDSVDRVWAVTIRGRVYRLDKGNKWKKMPIMASDIVTGPNGAMAVWSIKPSSDEHKNWIKANPYPKLWNGSKWQDITEFTEVKGMGFDSKGEPWLIAGKYNAPNEAKMMRRLANKSWQETPVSENLRHIGSDLKGNLWALSFKEVMETKKNKKNQWTTKDERIHRWNGKKWVDDKSIPDLHFPLFVSRFYLGSLFEFRGKLTYASKNYWISLRELTAEEMAKAQARAEKKKKQIALEKSLNPPPPKSYPIADTKWYGIIDILDKKILIDPQLVKNWKKGAYLHMRNDGVIGYNFKKAKDYIYAPENRWTLDKDENELVIQMGPIGYVFTLNLKKKKFVAEINKIFRMTIKR